MNGFLPSNLEVYQWLVPIISFYYIARTVRQYWIGKYSPRNTFVWIVFWSGIAALALLPDTIANSVANFLGFKDHINAIIFVALALLFLMVFYLSAALNRVEDRLTALIREIALERGLREYQPSDNNNNLKKEKEEEKPKEEPI